VVSVVQKNPVKWKWLLMKVRPEQSKAPVPVVQLIAAIVDYAGTPDKLLEMTMGLWPLLQVHRGHTHLRLMLAGKTEGDSVYVELG
jgi:hypothetical protein